MLKHVPGKLRGRRVRLERAPPPHELRAVRDRNGVLGVAEGVGQLLDGLVHGQLVARARGLRGRVGRGHDACV